ncbi:hypothetical protein PIB19_09220 [Sphingomonas sp. 7/4-4]|uniref:hypothetical protein n=1 Tax=Sphingomonas sp. 7/4-4 TaxID=3018446 RepID=UPI0022F38FFA|nr:hypothetical protein [Sphingomonas sp. 7/4-4]WBY09459.1 hypothetical protein PIB19_09220 [Sphingomonas sp. 7/4-4]
MDVGAASSAAQARNVPDTAGSEPPPQPRLNPIEQGDLAAGRLRVAEGQVFSGTSDSAPATRDWGDQPRGSGYREAFDGAAARLGTRDPDTVSAELDRQLYGTTPPAANDVAAPEASSDEEGLGSFVEGAVLGNFSDNHSWSATGGQVVVGFIPVVGQIADARDTIASVGQVLRGEDGGWLNLGASIVGWVPGIGDAAKAAIRSGGNLAEAGVDVGKTVARNADEATETGAKVARDIPPSANGVPGETIARTAERTGLPESKVREILDAPKPTRPAPSTYLSPEQIAAHLKPFEETGAIKFTPKKTLDDYGTLGPPDGGFVVSRREFEQLIEETGGDLAKVEDKLQLRPGELTDGNTVIAYIEPKDLQNLRVPSGNERGAWDGLWVPGGFTGKGVPEAVVDLPASTPYTPVKLGE